MMNTSNYPTIISVEHDPNPHLYEPSYNTYSSYGDYSNTSKLEAFEYNYWPTSTHNILAIPTITSSPSSATVAVAANTTTGPTNPIQTPPSTSPILENLPSNSSVHLSHINSTTISATHHHHHIHQHLYPSSNDPSNWLTQSDYQPATPYRHYPCPTNHFYDQTQWSTPQPTLAHPAIKFETPYSPPSYFESTHPLEPSVSDSKDEPQDSSYVKCQDQQEQTNWFKPQLNPVPPKNPLNGMSHH